MGSKLYVMRHGRTEWNKQGILQGRLDSPLLPESEPVLRIIAAELSKREIHKFFASPLPRSKRSAGMYMSIEN